MAARSTVRGQVRAPREVARGARQFPSATAVQAATPRPASRVKALGEHRSSKAALAVEATELISMLAPTPPARLVGHISSAPTSAACQATVLGQTTEPM